MSDDFNRGTRNFDSVSTEEASVTNETFIRATRGSGTGSTASGTFVNIYDGEIKDVRGEFSAAQFSPEKSGEYEIVAGADIRGNTTAGDEIQGQVRNVTDGTNLEPRQMEGATGSIFFCRFVFTVNLDSSKAYEVQVTNNDSSFAVRGSSITQGTIKRSVVE